MHNWLREFNYILQDLNLQMMGLWSFGTIAYTVNVIAVNLKVNVVNDSYKCGDLWRNLSNIFQQELSLLWKLQHIGFHFPSVYMYWDRQLIVLWQLCLETYYWPLPMFMAYVITGVGNVSMTLLYSMLIWPWVFIPHTAFPWSSYSCKLIKESLICCIAPK